MVGFFAVALLAFFALATPGSAEAGAIKVGRGTPESCTDGALRDALALAEAQGGGTIHFKCGKDPVAITLLATLIPPDNTTINGGGGLITLQATSPPRVVVGTILTVPEDTTVVLKGQRPSADRLRRDAKELRHVSSTQVDAAGRTDRLGVRHALNATRTSARCL